MIATPDNVRLVAEDLDHPEGLNFGPDGQLYAGGEAGQVYRIDPGSGQVTEIARTGGFHLGVAVDGGGWVYACDCRQARVVRVPPAGEVTTYSTGTRDRPLRVPNYGVFDEAGNLYVSDSGDYWNPEGTGCLFVISPEGKTEVFHPGPLPFPNGLALDPSGEHLYVIQSTVPNVVRLPTRGGRTGSSVLEVVVTLEDCVPDGLAFDSRGRLYIGCYKPDAIYRFSEGDGLETLIEDPTGELLSRPTNLALGDGGLFFANLGGWHIGVVSVDVKGAPLHYPRLSNSESA